jgi:hypothetical protein
MSAGIGVAFEYFNPNYAQMAASRWGLTYDVLIPEHIEEYIMELRRRRSRGGVFATNLQFRQFRAYLCNRHGKALFADAIVVHLFRADVVRQFASLHKALETGRYDFSDRRTRRTLSLSDRQTLVKTATALVTQDAGFRRLFVLSGIHPIFVESGEFFRNPRAVVEKISQALNVPVHQERLSEAIALSRPYEHRREHDRDREQILSAIMEGCAFDCR